MYQYLQNKKALRKGHVHKYEAVLWTFKKWPKPYFCYNLVKFAPRDLKIWENMYFNNIKVLHALDFKKTSPVQRNDKKITLLLY